MALARHGMTLLRPESANENDENEVKRKLRKDADSCNRYATRVWH